MGDGLRLRRNENGGLKPPAFTGTVQTRLLDESSYTENKHGEKSAVSSDKTISLAVHILRTLFGLWNLFFGLVFFFDINGAVFVIPQPMGHGELTPYLNQTLIDTDLFHVVKAIEIVVGILLLVNRAVPLSLCVYFPITVVIFHVNMFLEEFALGPVIAVIYLVVHLFLFWAYRSYYRPMLVWRASVTPGTLRVD